MEPDLLIAIFTLALAIATVWLAIATQKLSRVSAKALELESRPYFAFQDFQFNFYNHVGEDNTRKGKTDLRVALRFKNPSKTLVTFKFKSVHVTFDGRTADNPQFKSLGGTVYPGDATSFWFDVILNVDVSTLPRKGIAQFEVDYFSVDGGKHYSTRRKIEYFINGLDPFSSDWIYLEQGDE
jgi:archaellum component FlaG (FlaF/FlaG flagellin family)